MIVRGADTGRLDLAPQAAGLLALSLGLSALFKDDHEMLRHGMVGVRRALRLAEGGAGRDPRLAAPGPGSVPPRCGGQRGVGGELPGERSAFVHAGVRRRPAGARLRPMSEGHPFHTWP